MKRLSYILFSMTSTVVLLGLFAIAIGYATFAENSSGTDYAHHLIYNAAWFELLLTLLVINMIGSIYRFNLQRRRKFSILLFHSSFIIILIGAAITRIWGSEGTMHLREGETSNLITTDKSTLRIKAITADQQLRQSQEITFGENEENEFSTDLKISHKTIQVNAIAFIPNAEEVLEADTNSGPAMSLFVMNGMSQGRTLILQSGETTEIEGYKITFNVPSSQNAIMFSSTSNTDLLMVSNEDITQSSMMSQQEIILPKGNKHLVVAKNIYKSGELIFVLKKHLAHAHRSIQQTTQTTMGMSAMTAAQNAIAFDVSNGTHSQRIHLFTDENNTLGKASCELPGVKLELEYGKLPIQLPFSIHLRKFELDRYAGSSSPSSYASEITIIETNQQRHTPYRIYMNNILNHKGYRFFQSSYDEDERGTILSVNHDYWGTLVTYIGYLLMLIGMTLTLFNSQSRFRTVLRLSNELQQQRKVGRLTILILVLALSGNVFPNTKSFSRQNHLESLSSLLIQDETQGRIEPLSTYASDVIRKISKKNSWKGQSALEVFVDMNSNPSKWEKEAIIRVSHEELAKELGAVNEFVAMDQLVDFAHGGNYKLADKVNEAYRKDPSLRNQYEKELINVDERLNILNSVMSGSLLSIFPNKNSKNGKWLSATNQAETSMKEGAAEDICPMSGKSGMTTVDPTNEMNTDKCPVTGQTGMAGQLDESMQSAKESTSGTCPACAMKASNTMVEGGVDMSMDDSAPISPSQLIQHYLTAFQQAQQTGDWNDAEQALLAIKAYQQLNGNQELPSKTKVKMEVLYNKLSIFLSLGILYGIIGLILIAAHLLHILRYNEKLDRYLYKSHYLLLTLFVVYTIGLGLRWYISEHAPWSDGYEAMIFVGWATALAGLAFSSRNPITLAITSLLAATALGVAGMSWMNPEITNLVPVLKSYWLVIHVAVITSSYGFLGMGALLAFFNLSLMAFRTPNNQLRLQLHIQEYSYIIELSLTIGLFMLTVGTFLGGVWANESWGRYWGWDSKETWALVSVLVYSIVLHLRKIPRFNNLLTFNISALIAFSSVIMTFVGVNYYLSGMHSYGQGTPPPVPAWIYAGALLTSGVIGAAVFSERKIKTTKVEPEN